MSIDELRIKIEDEKKRLQEVCPIFTDEVLDLLGQYYNDVGSLELKEGRERLLNDPAYIEFQKQFGEGVNR